MYPSLIPKLFLIALVIGSFAGFTAAQDIPDMDRPQPQRPQDFKGNALRQLGLSRQQLQQIRRLNMDRKPRMEDAQMRLRDANRALDDIIYSDSPNDGEFQRRLRDFQAAQAEVAKVRFSGEMAVRNVLTPDQLVRFRRMRQRFEDGRMNGPGRRADFAPEAGGIPPQFVRRAKR